MIFIFFSPTGSLYCQSLNDELFTFCFFVLGLVTFVIYGETTVTVVHDSCVFYYIYIHEISCNVGLLLFL